MRILLSMVVRIIYVIVCQPVPMYDYDGDNKFDPDCFCQVLPPQEYYYRSHFAPPCARTASAWTDTHRTKLLTIILSIVVDPHHHCHGIHRVTAILIPIMLMVYIQSRSIHTPATFDSLVGC